LTRAQLFLLFALFLFPLAVYCLGLGFLHRRRHPLVVPGPWDFAGVLFAVSGFLAFGLPRVLQNLFDGWQAFLLHPSRRVEWLVDVSWYVRIAALAGYFLAVVLGAAAVLRLRRRVTVVYNVEPAAFDDACAQALDGLGLAWERLGNRILVAAADDRDPAVPAPHHAHISARPLPAGPLEAAPGLALPGGSLREQRPVLQLEVRPAPSHVLLRWTEFESPTPRPEIEAALAGTLARVWTRENAAAGWFLASGCLLLCSTFLFLMLALLFSVTA